MIGGGLGGLAAAARLARLKHDVVVVEATDVVGGMLGTHREAGYGWDTGPTALTLPATVRDLFLKTGKPLETVLDLDPLDPLMRVRFGDGTTMDVPNTGVGAVAAAFDAALRGRAGEQWREFQEDAGQVWAAVRGPLFESPVPRRRDAAMLALRHPGQLRPGRSLRDVAGRSFRDPRQRQLVEHYAAAVGVDPRRAPASLVVLPYIEHTFRGWTVRGGVRRLVDALHDRAVEHGAVVVTGVAAVSVTTASGRVDAVRLADGRRLPADVVVSDIAVERLSVDLLPAASAHSHLEPLTASTFTLLLGLRGRAPDVATRTLLLPADGGAALDAVFGADATAPAEPTLLVHASRAAEHAPADGEAWTVQAVVPRHGSGRGALDWTADGVAAAYAQQLLDRLAAAGRDVRERVVVSEHRSPADIERATGSPGGAAYGRAVSGVMSAYLRTDNRSTVPGLFLVGASAHPGGGVPAVLMSAALVADMVGRA